MLESRKNLNKAREDADGGGFVYSLDAAM
ncbi:hypothetical protein LCGC14_1393500, partial [marine sediment metagenome]